VVGGNQFRYILCNSKASDFWNGLKNGVKTKQSGRSIETLLKTRFPRLKAVIEKCNDFIPDEFPEKNTVWIVAENALMPTANSSDENPVNTIIRLLYKSHLSCSKMARNSLNIGYPVFATEHQIGTASIPTRHATSSSRFAADPSTEEPHATLTDNIILGLRFYIVETSASGPMTLLESGNSKWIWRLCCLSRVALQSTKFFVKVECRKWIEILQWMYLVCLLLCSFNDG
jgi:hypothetical protein